MWEDFERDFGDLMDLPVTVGRLVVERDENTRDPVESFEVAFRIKALKSRSRTPRDVELGQMAMLRLGWRFYFANEGQDVEEGMVLYEGWEGFEEAMDRYRVVRAYCPLGDHWEVDVEVLTGGG